MWLWNLCTDTDSVSVRIHDMVRSAARLTRQPRALLLRATVVTAVVVVQAAVTDPPGSNDLHLGTCTPGNINQTFLRTAGARLELAGFSGEGDGCIDCSDCTIGSYVHTWQC